jgi:hypothetical protein
MDVYPIQHKGMFLSIITDLDLTFVELRGVLDMLMEENAFDKDKDKDRDAQDDLGPGRLWDIEFSGAKYVVDVYNKDVVIYTKEAVGN